MVASSGCNNPNGGSVITNGNAPFLQPPAEFLFTQVRAKNGTVYLQWSGSRRVSEYKVYQGLSSSAITTEVPSCIGLLNSCIITGLDANTTYWYSVTAINAAGSQIINSSAPALSVGSFDITGSSASNGTIQISWNASSNATQYSIQYGFTPGVYSITVPNVTSPYNLTGLSNYQAHYYRVIATNASNGYAESDAEGTGTPIGPPVAPVGLSISTSIGSMALSWNAVTAAISYKVYRGTSPGALTYLATVPSPGYTDNTITDATTYYYAVVATNSLYDSVLSAEVAARSTSNFSMISANPTGVAHQIQVTWEAASGATSYSLRYGTSPGAMTNIINNVTSPATIPGLVSATTYYIRVYASNAIGAGTTYASTNTMSATTYPAAAAPSGVVANATPGQVVISWNSIPGVSSYELLRGTASGSYTVLSPAVVGNSYVDTSVSNGTSYFYALRSFNGLYSGNSLEVSAKPISAFTLSSVVAPNSSSLQVTWTPATGADAYDVRYGTSSGNYSFTASGVTSPYTLTGLSAATNYYIVVRARNAVGLGTNYQSTELSAQTKSATPTGLVAVSAPGQISLDWSNTIGASSYNVYRGTTSGSYSQIANSLLTSSYVDSTVTNGVTYFYVVTAQSVSESANSNEASSRSISSFSITTSAALTPTSVQITWPTVAGASTYDIRYGTTSGNYTSTLSNQTSPATVTGLNGGTTYYFIVTAKNAVSSGSTQNSPEIIQSTPVGPPAGVAAVVSNDQVNLTWNTMAGASSYKVYRGTTSGSHTLLASNIVPTNYVDSTAVAGTRYYYVVKSFSGADSVNSLEVTGKVIDAWALTSVTAPGSTSLQVTFSATDGGDFYDVGYSTTSGSGYTYASSVTSPYIISSLTPNTTYYIVGRARNTVGAGASRLTAQTVIKTPTATPSGLVAVSNPGSVSLTWTATTGGTTYKIFRGTTSGSYTEISSGVATNSYTDTSAENGTIYFYAIRANNGSDSANSNEVTTRPIASFAVASVTSPSATSLEVTWPGVSGASAYDVRWGTTSGNYVSQSLNATSPFTITGLSANTTYFVLIRAKNTTGNGTTLNSAEVSLKTPTAAPSGLVATASFSQVGLNWTSVSGASSYKIYRGTSSGAYTEIADNVGTNAYLDTTVVNGTTYFYAVRAFNGSDSGNSNEVSLRPVSSFSLTAATPATSTSINLTWGSATGAATYDVRYGTSSGVYLGTVSNVTSPYTLTGLTANTQYFISIRAANTIGSGAFSDSNELNTTTGTSAPSSLAAITTTGQIALSWTAATGSSSYRVFRGTTSGTFSQIATGVTGTTYTDTTVSNGTQYFYVVRSFNGIESVNSNEATGLPMASFTLSSTSAPTTSTVQLSWPAVTGAASYNVKYGTVSGGPYTTLSGVTSPYTITGLSASTRYYIVVEARNIVGTGTSSISSEASQVTPLGAPTGLASSATPGSVSLSWTAVAGASSYKVYKGTASGSHSEIANNVSTNSYTDSSVSNGTSYFYVVSAFNGADSAVSNETSIRPVSSFTITSATPSSPNQINVSWPAVTGAVAYDVKYGTTSGTYSTTLSNQTSPASITGLSVGETYFIVVVARNAVGSGTSVQSAEVGATTAFGAPSGLTASATPGQVNLTWNAVSGATSYKVYRGISSGSYTEIESSALTNSYIDTTVLNGTTYFYAVVAFNGATSPFSSEVSIRPVSSFTFSSAAVASSSGINLTWTSATGASSYDVRYGTSAGSYTTTVTNVTSPNSVTGLSAGTTYYFQIKAKNSVGSGTTVNSSELNAITSANAPTALSATASTGQIVLNWTAAAGATNYNVYRSIASGSGYSSVASAVSSTSYTDTSVSNGTQYFYVVRANNGTESVNSNEATAASIAAFAITSTTAPTSSTIQVIWPAVSGATSYDVRYGTSSGSYSTTVSGVTSPYTITGLTSATNYYIVVRANNAIGSGSSSQTAQSSQITPLGAPSGLAATATPGSVALSWNNVSGASSYKVYRGTTSGSHSLLTSSVGTNAYTDNTISNGTQYFYVVKAFNGADSADSNEVTILPMANFSISSTSSPSSTSIEVNWTGPTGASTFDVRYGTSSGVYSTTLTGVTSPYTIAGLNPGTTYFIAVRSNNSVGAGTQVTSSQSSQLTALGAPTGLIASATPGSVGLNWNAQSGVTTYEVYRGTTSGSLVFLSNAASNAYMDTTVANGTTYFYAVLANNGSDSALSSEVSLQAISSFSLTAAAAASASSINLTWGSATGAASYDVRYGTTTGVYLASATGVISPYVLTGLTAGTTYFISIQAKNAVGTGTVFNSNELNAKTAVGAPSGLAAVSTPGNAALSWGAVSGATNYNVYRSTTTNGPYTQVASAVTATTYNDNSVVNGTIYYYVVRTFNGIESADSSEVATRPIGNFTLAAATVNSSTQASVSWGAATGASTYDVRVGTVSGTYSATYTNVTSPYVITGLSAASLYYVIVRANNTTGNGTSNNSNEISLTTTTAAPTSLTAAVATGQINLSWVAASGATSYRIFRSTTSGSGYTQIASGIAATNYSDTTVVNGTQYYFVIRAFNGTESTNSNEATGLPITGFSITSTTAPTTTTIEVTWPATAGATAYDVRYGTSSASYSVTAAGATSPHTLTGLSANTTYFIVVRARNSIGSGTNTSTPEVSQITPVAAPVGLVATGGTSRVDLSWTSASGATSYKIFRGTTSGSLTQIASGVSGTNYADTTAVNGTQYYYALKSFNGADSALSSEVTSMPVSSFSISSITGPSTTSISVAWAAATGATTYNLKYGTVSGTYATTIPNVTSPHIVTGLAAGTTYFVQMVAKNLTGTGTSVNSAQSSGATNSAPVLTAVADQASDGSAKTVNFSLTDSNDILTCTGAMSGSSTNTTLVPNANITFSGTMPNCSATITPAAGQSGSSTITLTANDGKNTTSTNFLITVTGCTVASITWETQPTSINAGSTWASAPQAGLRKADGTLCTNNSQPVSLSITTDNSTQADAAVSGGFSVIPVNGIATFSTATITRAASNYTLAASQDLITSANSSAFNVTALTPNKWIWAVAPSTSNRTSVIVPNPQLRAADIYGNPVTYTTNTTLALTLQDNTEGATLGGTTSLATSSGLATFTNLTINLAGSYFLSATASNGWTVDNSPVFSILNLTPVNTVASLEMLTGAHVHTGQNTSYPGVGMSFGSNHFNGTVGYQWQIVATNTDNQDSTVRLRLGTTNIVQLTIPRNTSVPTAIAPVTIPNGSVTAEGAWSLRVEKGTTTIYSSRIIATQTGATRTMAFIPLTSTDNNTTATQSISTTSTTHSVPNQLNLPTYAFDGSKIGRIDTALLYVTSRANACVALWNNTTNTQIGSEICNGSGSDSIASVAIPASSLPAGAAELQVRMRSSSGSAAYVTKAGLLLRLVSIEKMLVIQRTAGASTALTAGVHFTENRARSYRGSYGTGTPVENYVCRAKNNGTGSGSFILRDHGASTSGTTTATNLGTNIFSTSSFENLEQPNISTTNNNYVYTNYTHTSGSLAVSHCILETEVSYPQ